MLIIAIFLVFASHPLSINQNHGISWNHSHGEESQKILKPFESYCYHLLPVYVCWPMVLTSRCSSCLLHIHDCSVLQRKCGWTTWDWVEGPSLSWRPPVPAQGLQHRLPGLACWSNCPRRAFTASNKPKHWSSRGRCSPTKVRRCINNLIWQCALSPSLTTQYISPSCSEALEIEAFVVNRALVQQVTSATLPPKEWPQTTRSAEGVTPACESLESKSNHWRVVKRIRAFSCLS